MTERVFARQIQGDLWQWRLLTNHGEWASDAWDTGDDDALKETMPTSAPVLVMLNGQAIISSNAEMEEKDKRHIAKLLPYEMEEQLIDAVEDLHFSYGDIVDGNVSVLYGRDAVIQEPVDSLTNLGCDVFHALPDYLMLTLPEGGGATLVMDSGIVYIRLGPTVGLSVDAAMAPQVISRIDAEYDIGARIHLVAENDEEISKLHSWLPKHWVDDGGPEVVASRALFWDMVDTSLSSEFLNMRRGKFSRRLPINNWINIWKIPGIFLGVAFVLALAVQFSSYLTAKSEVTSIRKEINAVYKDAVPNGRPGDPEGSLRSLARGVDTNTNEPTNFMSLLNNVSQAIAKSKKTTLTTFSYNGTQRSLQLTLEVESISELSTLREEFSKRGVKTDSPRTNRIGERFQARIKATEASQ